MAGDAQHQAGGNEGQSNPTQPPGPSQFIFAMSPIRSNFLGDSARSGIRRGSLPNHPNAGESQKRQDQVTDRPYPTLILEGQAWLDQDWVTEQSQHAAQVAGGIEEVGISSGAMAGARKPLLKQWRTGGDDEKRQADANH